MSREEARHRPGLLLRLAGPLQSWGEKSHFTDRDTARFPTRSGVVGMLAAALGRTRDAPLDDLSRLSLTVRVDRPGILLTDLHTVGGGLPTRDTVTTAEGKKRSGAKATLVSHRAYLADAAFTVALTATEDGPDTDTMARYADALRRPRWPYYLGRRSCPPEGPVLLARTDRPLHHLLRLPVAAKPPRGTGPLHITFLSDEPLDGLPLPEKWAATPAAEAAQPTGEVHDDPRSFHPKRRSYRVRLLYRRVVSLPKEQCAGLGTAYLARTQQYLEEHLGFPERGQA